MSRVDPAARRAYQAEYIRAHQAGLRAAARDYYARNRERRIGYSAAYRHANREKIAAREKANRAQIRARRHGLAAAWITERYEAQGGRCAICRDPRPMTGRNGLVIDHDHESGVRRGLICRPCNTALPVIVRFGTAWSERAQEYLAIAVTYAEGGR